MVDRSVPRDIFPLPPPDAPRADGNHMKANLQSRRRHGRCLHAESARWSQLVADLNWCHGGVETWAEPLRPSGAQCASLDFLRDAVRWDSPKNLDLLDPEAALASLLGCRAGYSADASQPMALAGYKDGCVALPKRGATVRLDDTLSSSARETFVAERLLRPDAEWRLEVAGRRPYWDPVLLEDRCSYITFIHSLRARNMLRFRRRRLGHAGIFFVKKKNGDLRLIVDGRIGNCILVPPPKVHLASSGTFAELRVDNVELIFLSALDVENAFHNYEIPEWLSELYGLNAVTADEMASPPLTASPSPLRTKFIPV